MPVLDVEQNEVPQAAPRELVTERPKHLPKQSDAMARVLSWAKAHRFPLMVVGLVLIAIGLRLSFFGLTNGDARTVTTWYQYLAHHGRFAALGNDHLVAEAKRGNYAPYNEPYLYLLAAVSYFPVSPLIGIKLISVSFDLVLAFFSYRLVRLRHPVGCLPLVAAAVILFLPTVVMNSSVWGQVDASYAALCLGGIYFLVRRRPWLGCLYFGLALAFKLQAVFIFPVLGLLVLRRYIPWRSLLAIPLALIAVDIPALLAGAHVSTLASIYTTQAGTYHQLTMDAPNIYQLLPASIGWSPAVAHLGILAAALIAGGIVAWLTLRRVEINVTRIILVSCVLAIAVPYVLPTMHQRYFYLADVLSVLVAFYLPRHFLLPICVQFASGLAYLPFLFRIFPPWRLVAMVMLAALALVIRAFVREFASSVQSTETVGTSGGELRSVEACQGIRHGVD